MVVLWLVAAVVRADSQSSQAESVARQQEAVTRQRESVSRQSIPKQLQSVRRQMESAGTLRLPPGMGAVRQLPPCDAISSEEISSLAREAAEKEGLTPDLLRAVIGKESAFRPCAVSPKGAMGLMQLMPDTARRLGVTNPFDPRQNVAAGSKFLRTLLDRYGEAAAHDVFANAHSMDMA